MRFEEALIELRKGKKISLGIWMYSIESIKDDSAINLSFKELFSEDWEVLEEPGKTFPEVFEAFKDGKHIRRKKWPLEDRMSKSSRDDLLATDWEIID